MSYEQRFGRNIGFITHAAQERLARMTIAVAGAGGDGGQAALTLARLGVERFRLADPEPFEIENSNRQAGCTLSTIGRNKARVIADLIQEINPDASVEIFANGVLEENVEDFVAGADIVIDETEYTIPDVALSIARVARDHDVPIITVLNVGFGSIFTSFMPGKMTLDRFLGVDGDRSSDAIPLWRWIPRLPTYMDADALGATAQDKISAPSVAPGVQLAAAVLGTEVVRWATTGRFSVCAPSMLSLDLYETKLIRMRMRRFHWCLSLVQLVIRDKRSRSGRALRADARRRRTTAYAASTALAVSAGALSLWLGSALLWALTAVAGIALLLRWASPAARSIETSSSEIGGRRAGDLPEDRIMRIKLELARGNRDLATQLAKSLDARNSHTLVQSATVGVYARDIAGRLGLDAEQCVMAHLAGLVHDIGRIGVSAEILNKLGPLSPAEFEELKQHPKVAADLLEGLAASGTIAQIVRHHHERLDGFGYPDGLRGDAIPLLSRVVAVADTYCALIASRPYRRGMEPANAITVLEEAVDQGQLDPRCVAAFLEALASESETYVHGEVETAAPEVARRLEHLWRQRGGEEEQVAA